MKELEIYKKLHLDGKEAVFNYLIDNLMPTINSWSYLVDWNKVCSNISEIEVNLNILNYLIGKKNIEKEFVDLIKKYPDTKKVLPILVACREKIFTIITDYNYKKINYSTYNFNALDDKKALEFARGTGILKLFNDFKIKNLVDYVFGVEVGIGTHGRKNRAGSAMEDLVDMNIKKICKDTDMEYLQKASSASVQAKWNIDLAVDRSNRILDFIIKNGNLLYLIEVNFYSGVGSKLKATAGEYKAINKFWLSHGYRFIWITDGFGWKNAKKPLSEAFEDLDFVLNIKMIYDGVLASILKNKL